MLAAALLMTLACSGPVKVKPAQPAAPQAEPPPIARQRGLDSLSRQTQQLLRLYGLEDPLPRYPTALVAVLSGLEGSELERDALAAEAEVALLAARYASNDASAEAAGWYLQSTARAFEFMFNGGLTPMERAMDPRFQRMRRVYNLAVSSYVGLLGQSEGGFRHHEASTRFER